MKNNIDICIKGATIVDGTGADPFTGDLGIAGDKIVFIHKKMELTGQTHQVKADKTIEARDMIVAPGFIDTHAHSEFTLLADPRAEGKICQGITTEINGNCGLSAAPLYGETLRQRQPDLEELGIRERWTTIKEYCEILEGRALALNFVTLAGHGNIRACVAGYHDRKLTEADRREMGRLLKDAVLEGARGLSTGLIYPPGVFSDTEELIELCRVLSLPNKRTTIKSPHPYFSAAGQKRTAGRRAMPGIYTSHMRSEGDKLIESVEEIIRIAKESGISIHISHLKTSGEKNWHKIDKVLSIIGKAKSKGLGVTADRYPYTAASTDLDTILPSWVHEGGAEEEMKKLKSTDVREQIKREIVNDHPELKYWENTYVSSVSSEKNRWTEGMSIASIARRRGYEPVDMFFKILIDEKLRAGAIFQSMNEENLKRFLSLPYVMIGTDSSARSLSGITHRGKPHPRGFGSFPRFLGKYVREESLMDLSEAIRKITCLPAETFGIHKRGMLREGAFADIVVFDFRKILDKATYSDPFIRPEGIYYVIVNGRPAVWEGELMDIRAGRVLRHGR